MSEAQLCQTPLRMNGYFGNLTFLPEKNLLQNFKLFEKSFPATRNADFAYFQVFEIFSRILSSISFLPILLDISVKIFTTRLKAISKILAALICYSKCRCLSFVVYLDITITDHESWLRI